MHVRVAGHGVGADSRAQKHECQSQSVCGYACTVEDVSVSAFAWGERGNRKGESEIQAGNVARTVTRGSPSSPLTPCDCSPDAFFFEASPPCWLNKHHSSADPLVSQPRSNGPSHKNHHVAYHQLKVWQPNSVTAQPPTPKTALQPQWCPNSVEGVCLARQPRYQNTVRSTTLAEESFCQPS